MDKTDLAYLPAHQALDMFRAKTLSPVEHMQALIDRAAEVEPKVNALPMTYHDQAMDAAKKAEAKYAAGKRTRTLEGLAVGIKDESTIKGMPTTFGSLSMKDNIGEVTLARERKDHQGGWDRSRPHRDAGVFLHGDDAYETMGCYAQSVEPVADARWIIWWAQRLRLLPGRRRWRPDLISVVLSAFHLRPAACSGSNPRLGRNPADSPFNLDQYAVDGPLARTAKDMVLLQNVMSGPHKDDMVSIRPKLRISSEVKSLEGWKIAYSPQSGILRSQRRSPRQHRGRPRRLPRSGGDR